MQPNHFDLIVLEACVAERQARIKSDIQALRAGPSLGHSTGALRRRLGQTLIALGNRLTEPADEMAALPAQPVLGGAVQR